MEYLKHRWEHINLERQKVPFTIEEEKRERAIRKLSTRMSEIKRIKRAIDDLDRHIEYEKGKVEHLKKMKIAHLKGEFP